MHCQLKDIGCKIVLSVLMMVLGGCATFPSTVPVTGEEFSNVQLQFLEMLKQNSCAGAIDYDATITFRSMLFQGTISGYLQAEKPDQLRFEGVNPLGLTELLLAVNGSSFNYVNVREQKSYFGKLDASMLNSRVPEIVAKGFKFHWLTGEVESDGVKVQNVGADQDGKGYWLDIVTADNFRQKVLFDPQNKRITHILLLKQGDSIGMEILYDYPANDLNLPSSIGTSQEEYCLMPDKLTVKYFSNSSIVLQFDKRYPVNTLSPKSIFQISAPADYNRIEIK